MAEDTLLGKNNYLLEMNRRSDMRMKKLKDGEEEKTTLKNDILLLQKKENDLRRRIENQNGKISKLKLEEYSLAEEKKFLNEMEEKNHQNKCSKEDELWKMRQSVYSSVALHCDGILDVLKNYSLKNMKEFIESKAENRECFNKDSNPFAKAAVETSEKHGTGRKKLLTNEISRLKFSIEKLKEEEVEISKGQSKRAELKYEPVNGEEYIRLQNEQKDLRDDILTITNEISTLEGRNPVLAVEEDMSQDIASKNSSYYDDSLQSPCSSYSRDSYASSSTQNRFQENVEQNNNNGCKPEQDKIYEKFQNDLGKSSTQDRRKIQESSKFKEPPKSTKHFVYKTHRYFKQS